MRERELEPLERRRQAHVAPRVRRRLGHVAHGQERREDGDERHRVERVDPRQAGRGDEEPRQRRSEHRGHLEHDRVERDRVGQHLARHQLRDERLPRRPVERPRRRPQPGQQVERPQGMEPAEREHGEDEGEERHQALRHQHEPPALVRVGDHAREDREQDDRHEAHQPDHAQGKALLVRRRKQRDVPQHGRRLHHRAGERHELPQPEQAEVAVVQGVEGWGRGKARDHGRNIPRGRVGVGPVRSENLLRTHSGAFGTAARSSATPARGRPRPARRGVSVPGIARSCSSAQRSTTTRCLASRSPSWARTK